MSVDNLLDVDDETSKESQEENQAGTKWVTTCSIIWI